MDKKQAIDFLRHHKRGCLANKGSACTCGLYDAREELEEQAAALRYVTQMLDIGDDNRPVEALARAAKERIESLQARVEVAEALLKFAVDNADKFAEYDPDGVKSAWLRQVAPVTDKGKG